MLRALKLAKYLPSSGWEVEVLSVDDPVFHQRDEAALTEVNCPVHRVPAHRLPSAAKLLNLKKAPVDSTSSPSVNRQAPGWKEKLRVQLPRLGELPDIQLRWSKAAQRRALTLARQNRYSVVWTTSPPASSHLIGLALSRQLGLPWVADFRDSWTTGPFFNPLTPPHRWWNRRLERQVVESADAVVFATPTMAENYRRTYPTAADRFSVITNGYDETDFAELSVEQADPGTVTIGHAGTFYGPRKPDAFLTALEQVGREHPRAKLHFVEIGSSSQENETTLNRFAEEHPHLITRRGNLSHHQALATLNRCQILLLVIGRQLGSETILTGKLFEYLRLGKQILACCPPGDAADLLRELGVGVIADPDSYQEIAAALRKLLKAPDTLITTERIQRFERGMLARRWAQLFSRLQRKG
ncbi:glycosyltransferase [bacterium]|nr:glycosyltransferase [bacterium]